MPAFFINVESVPTPERPLWKGRVLYNQTQGAPVIANCRLASTFKDRLLGLLPCDHLPADHGLLILSCVAIHTWFMRFPIDCFFLDARFQVLQIVPRVTPFRSLRGIYPHTAHVLETAARDHPLPLRPGDELLLRETPPDDLS